MATVDVDVRDQIIAFKRKLAPNRKGLKQAFADVKDHVSRAGDRILIGRLEKRKENGGLCQNCHGLAPGEINVGNVGPSLTGYGLQRGNSEAIAKLTYERIYNAWAYSPCSNMPRLGANRHLTPEQVTHMVAYLLDPASPINKK